MFLMVILTIAALPKEGPLSYINALTIRKTYTQNDLNAALTRKKRTTPPIETKITGEVEAHIIALACTKPPNGYAKWSLRLLANKTVELNYIDQISHVSVGTVLKTLTAQLLG